MIFVYFATGLAVGITAGRIFATWRNRRNDGYREIYPQWRISGPGTFEIDP